MSARTVLSAEPSAAVAEMPPVDVVNLRFPADWTEVPAAPETAPRMLAYASADSGILFSPNPTYALASAGSSPVTLSYATTSVAKAAPLAVEPLPRPKPATQAAAPAPANPAPAKMTLASVSTKPAVAAPSRPAPRSNAVLNDSQLASIKKRLNLTPDQERYWPAVEAELRKMEYTKTADKKSTQGTRMASIDTTKMDVDGLKSAGFPLVMSFSDDQRRELKSLAHLLGLESVMSGI